MQFLGKSTNLFVIKNLNIVFQLKSIAVKNARFPNKLPCYKPMLRQIEWTVSLNEIHLDVVTFKLRRFNKLRQLGDLNLTLQLRKID